MIIADTGFFFALASKRDRYHSAAMLALETINEPLITTYPVITETCHLLLAKGRSAAQSSFLKSMAAGGAEIFSLQESHLLRMIELIERYADLPMDLADASLVVLAEQLGHRRIFSSDRRDFLTYRWRKTQPFENILLRYF